MNLLDNLSIHQRSELLGAMQTRGGILEFAERYGLNSNSLRGALSRRGGADALQPETPEEAAPAQQAHDTLKTIRSLGPVPQAVRVIDEPKTLHLDRFLYASDFHVPLHSERAIERLVKVALALEIEDLVIGGDLTDQDCLSSHPADLPQVSLNQAIEVAGQVIRYLRTVFPRLYVLPGNHDRRMAKALNKDLGFKYLVQMCAGSMDGITVTDNDYFYINTSSMKSTGWTVGHPRFFAAYPTKGLDVVAQQRQRSVVGAHSHTIGLVRLNQFWCVSPGMMMRPDLTPYVVRSNGLSKFGDQTEGFVMVEATPNDGDIVTLYADGLTRWSDYE